MINSLEKSIYLWLSILVLGIFSPTNFTMASEIPDRHYYSAQGFDFDGDGQVDYIDTGQAKLLAVELPGQPGVYLQSNLGGIAAPMAYYPDVAGILTEDGLTSLIGDGTFENPQLGSALEFRTKLYSTSGANALRAFYTTAVQAFTPKLLKLTAAEEKFREALRVDPFYQDALNGLLEVYYARAEGFMLIGNDYIAKAYRHKYDRAPNEVRPIAELEVGSIEAALISYEVGFREFMKLFNPDFVGLSKVRKPHLDIDPEWLFFEKRIKDPKNPLGDLVAFESLRGQKNAIGMSSSVFNDIGEEILPVQGSPSIELEITNFSLAKMASQDTTMSSNKTFTQTRLESQIDQLNTINAPVKFQLPIIVGSPDFTPGTTFTLHFNIDSDVPIKAVEILIEFDHEKLDVPNNLSDIDFTGSNFPENTQFYAPGSVYKGIQIFANQMLIRGEAVSPVSGIDLSVVKIPFLIKSDASGSFYVYAAGSGGSLLSGYKDIAIVFRLAAAHANATGEKVRRLYNAGNEAIVQDCISYIEEEVELIGSWFEHLQALLAMSSTPEEIANIDQLQSAINQVAAELSNLSALREFIRSGANVFGFPHDYLPFYDLTDVGSFEAIKNIVLGQGGDCTPQSATGFFGIARGSETDAVLNKDKFEDTKDRIRNELFTINEQAENRLVQICGRVDENCDPSLKVNDPIDYEMCASPRNTACEIGQNILLLEQSQKRLERANADIDQFLEDIEIEKRVFQEEIKLKEEIPGIIEEYNELQLNLDKEISEVLVTQMQLNAAAQAAATLASSIDNWANGSTGFGAAVAAAIQLANGMTQAELEKRKGELQRKKSKLAAFERIELIRRDTEIFKLQRTKDIEKMVNDVVLYTIATQIAEIDVQLSLGQLNNLVMERDELLARRGRAIANLGEMSFADPSFRLTQFKAMKDAEIHLEFLKRWLYVLTRSLYYKWALQDDYVIPGQELHDISIHDVRRIQVVGALNEGISETPLDDQLTAADYVCSLLAFDLLAPLRLLISDVQINRVNSNNSARYSLREDFLRIVRNENAPEETQRVRDAFRAWITSPDRLDQDGNLVIEFDTMEHLENYNIPVNENHGTWTNFALRSYSTNPLWNHKITQVGVALKAVGLAFTPGNANVTGSLEYGGTGYIKGNSYEHDDFNVYQMKQWRFFGNGIIEPVEVRTIGLTIPASSELESNEGAYMVVNLKERPVTASYLRLFIPMTQVANIYLENIEDIFIYIYSEAYIRQ